MTKPNFNFTLQKNFPHPFSVIAFNSAESDEDGLKNAAFMILPTTKELEGKQFIVKSTMLNQELETNAEFNIANNFFKVLPFLQVVQIENNEIKEIDIPVLYRSLVSTTMDTLAQTISYDQLFENDEPPLANSLANMIAALLGIDHPLSSDKVEVALASELESKVDEIYEIYHIYAGLQLSKQNREKLNYHFWSALTMISCCNNLVFVDESVGYDFSQLAYKKVTPTVEIIKKAIKVSLPYFDKKHIKREIADMIKHDEFELANNRITCQNLIINLKNEKRMIQITPYVKFKVTISILYRAYLTFIKSNTQEKLIKQFDADLEKTLRSIIQHPNEAYSTKILDDLFTIVKKPRNTLGNHDVDVFFSEEITDLIKSLALKS